MQCFNNDFNKDDNGVPKHWPELDEGKIHDDFKTSQTRTFSLLEEFRTCNVPKNLTVLQAESQSIEKRDNSSRTTVIPGANMLTSAEISFVKEKLEASMIEA